MDKKTLYGKAKTGKIKIWNIWTVDGSLFIEHGQLGGKLQIKHEGVSGKNIGKSNETSPSRQAELEALSRWKKQVDKGYRETVEELDNLGISVMLAHDYLKQGHRIKYPCFGSPKLDGVRCLAIRHPHRVELKSRGGKEYIVPHIQEQLMLVMREGDVFDGELYIHGKYLEEIVSCVKKINDDTPDLEFIIFDVVNNESYEHRLITIQSLRRYTLSCVAAPSIDVINFCELENEEHMKEKHKEYVAQGYEGIMIRSHDGKYESGKRSADLQKYKEFFDKEFEILRVEVDRNGNAVLICWCDLAQAEFGVCYGDFEERQRQKNNPEFYVKKALTVKFQTRYKDSRLPQFPTGVMIREGGWVNGEFIPSE